MFRMFTRPVAPSESSSPNRHAARRPRRARPGLEALEGRRVPTALLASAAMMSYYPGGPITPATVSYFPPSPIMPAAVSYYPPSPITPARVFQFGG